MGPGRYLSSALGLLGLAREWQWQSSQDQHRSAMLQSPDPVRHCPAGGGRHWVYCLQIVTLPVPSPLLHSAQLHTHQSSPSAVNLPSAPRVPKPSRTQLHGQQLGSKLAMGHRCEAGWERVERIPAAAAASPTPSPGPGHPGTGHTLDQAPQSVSPRGRPADRS